jgi:hypothetical protein
MVQSNLRLTVVCICFIESLSLFVFVLSRSYHCFICCMGSLSLFLFVLWRVYRFLYLFYRDLIVVCIYFIESLSLFVFILSRAYRCLHLFYLELINVCIYFIEILALLVFVLSRAYRYLYLFYWDLIVVCICFIEILSLLVFALSRAYRLYLFFTCDVGEIDNEFRVNTILLPVIFLCAWAPTSMKFRIQFIGDIIIILWIRYYLRYAHFLWISWFVANREIRNWTNMCHHIYLPIKLTSLNWNEFTISLIIKSWVCFVLNLKRCYVHNSHPAGSRACWPVEVSALIIFVLSPTFKYLLNVCFTGIVLCIHGCDFWTLLAQSSSLIITGDCSNISAHIIAHP